MQLQVAPSLVFYLGLREMRTRVFYLILAIAFIVALVGLSLEPGQWFTANLTYASKVTSWAHRFLEALLIAIFLAVTVDLFVKSRLAETVARNVAGWVFTMDLPEQLRGELNHLRTITNYRRNNRFKYKIETIANYPDLVKLILDHYYDMVNITDIPQPYNHYLEVQTAYIMQSTVTEIRYVFGNNVFTKNGMRADYDEHSKPGAPIGALNRSGTMRVWQRTTYLPRKGESHFRNGAEYIFPAEHVEPIVLVVPGVDVEIEVDYPHNQFLVEVKFGHRKRADAVAIPKKDPNTWKLPAGFLPYQVVILEWRRKTQSVSKT